ncbi:hypothetical protein [Galbibacter pacificus]|uniref:Uncharacterized protein n=1 Tax=Galbibacter pacificus TaxID=2996052 RepID=A0ABT6FR64_9FLAO|nr:hypothetical protein [Galbibacter pacificus]MDG3581764.1 hypothetical protein [Galbibacter pacificus]MDG3585762.1 hypothetical protein [Galbibacter pacificus]
MKKFLMKLNTILKKNYCNKNYCDAQLKLNEIKNKLEIKYNMKYNELVNVELINEDK